ncbi:MAG TPA: hypothetical protein VFE32_06725 [Puia sp.]|jgi:hypothetical protein|nr:hypothetical protein [Puia sp.]
MKMLKFILFVAVTVCFTGCLDIYEKIDVKKDGSGTVTMDMDMSQMLELLQQYMGKEEMEKKGISKMDTTIDLKDVLDSVNSLPADKKALLSAGTIHIKLDMDAKVFTTHMKFPFSNQDNLQKLYAALGDGSLGSAKLLKNLGGDEGGGDAGPSPDINQFNGIYDFTCHDGVMTKKVNQEKWKALQNDPQMAQVKQAAQMGMEISYTTTIILPRPVKKIDNATAKLSDDKKTVVMKFNLIDAFDHPEQFGYSIEY